MKNIFAAAAVAIALGAPAGAATFTFDSFAANDAIDFIDFGNGITADVTTNSNRAVSNGGTNQARAFDTNAFTGNDSDLKSDFPRTSNPSDKKNLGMVAVIAGPVNNVTNPNGLLPDDDRQGGTISFLFNQLVSFQSVDYVDTESGSNVLDIVFRDMNGSIINLPSASGLVAGNGQFDTFSANVANVKQIDFNFGGSGALDNLAVTAVPIPAGLPLLAGGLAFLGFAARRRKS